MNLAARIGELLAAPFRAWRVMNRVRLCRKFLLETKWLALDRLPMGEIELLLFGNNLVFPAVTPAELQRVLQRVFDEDASLSSCTARGCSNNQETEAIE